MNRILRLASCVMALTAGLTLSAGAVLAEDYPTDTVRIIVPFPPGGTVDVLGRLMAEQLSGRLGQSVVVENMPGATGIIGAEHVAQARADGHTLLMASTGPMTVAPAIRETVPYNTANDFAPIIQVAGVPLLLVVHPDLPVQSVTEFVEYVRERPGEVSFASSGIGSSSHLSGEMLNLAADLDMVHVPYRGGAPAATDVLGGRIEAMFQLMVQMQPHVAAGDLRALAITSRERSDELPDVPTMIESGFEDFEVVTWFGMFAPAGTPEPIVEKLNSELSEILKLPEMQERLSQLGAQHSPNTAADFASFIHDDLAKWEHVIEEAGIELMPD